MDRKQIILLIEDNPDDEVLTIRTLKKQNVENQVVVVRNGAEALDFLFPNNRPAYRAATPVPNLVLLDLKLPKVDGMEVLRRIKADSRTKRVPVVILTSSLEQRDLATGYDLGANSYITKPVDFEQFSAAVSQIGRYWLSLNQPPPMGKGNPDGTAP